MPEPRPQQGPVASAATDLIVSRPSVTFFRSSGDEVLVIVWRNLRKDDKPDTPSSDPDAYMRVARQRHHSWEGSFSFWFDKASQQFLEFEAQRPTFVDVGRAYA